MKDSATIFLILQLGMLRGPGCGAERTRSPAQLPYRTVPGNEFLDPVLKLAGFRATRVGTPRGGCEGMGKSGAGVAIQVSIARFRTCSRQEVLL